MELSCHRGVFGASIAPGGRRERPSLLALQLILLLACYAIPPAHADCGPESEASPAFKKSLKLAMKGNAIEQRNVAASYEAGYQVEPCFSRAYHWYKKAAEQGDEISMKWMERNSGLIELMKGAECIGAACNVPGVDYGATGMARAGEDGHFYAPLTVNGRSIQGMIDTGATVVALTAEAAAILGIDFSQGVQNTTGTANGALDNRIVTVPTLTVAGVSMDNVQVSCCINSTVSLIGMSFLSRVRLSVTGETLTIRKY